MSRLTEFPRVPASPGFHDAIEYVMGQRRMRTMTRLCADDSREGGSSIEHIREVYARGMDGDPDFTRSRNRLWRFVRYEDFR
jgi:hypothetical protein